MNETFIWLCYLCFCVDLKLFRPKLLSEHLRRQRKRRTWTWWSRSTYGLSWSNMPQKQNVQVTVWSLDPFFIDLQISHLHQQYLFHQIQMVHAMQDGVMLPWRYGSVSYLISCALELLGPRVVNFGRCFFCLRGTSLSLGATPFDSSWVHVREVLRVLEARLFHGSGLKWQEVVVAQSDKNFTAHDRVFRYSECRM